MHCERCGSVLDHVPASELDPEAEYYCINCIQHAAKVDNVLAVLAERGIRCYEMGENVSAIMLSEVDDMVAEVVRTDLMGACGLFHTYTQVYSDELIAAYYGKRDHTLAETDILYYIHENYWTVKLYYNGNPDDAIIIFLHAPDTADDLKYE